MTKTTKTKATGSDEGARAPRDVERLYRAHQVHALAQLAWLHLTTGAGRHAAWPHPGTGVPPAHPGRGPAPGLTYWYP